MKNVEIFTKELLEFPPVVESNRGYYDSMILTNIDMGLYMICDLLEEMKDDKDKCEK